jgi:hypothetical protein
VCDRYVSPKGDYVYRGDVLEDVPFLSLNGDEIWLRLQGAYSPNAFIEESKRRKPLRRDEDCACYASVRRSVGVVITRTCEGAKAGSTLRTSPRLWVAPIRPAEYYVQDGDPIEFAQGVERGFINEDGIKSRCYRFYSVPKCESHRVPGGILSFREMQPIHAAYLIAAKKLARFSLDHTRVLMSMFDDFNRQDAEDDKADEAPEELEPGSFVKKWSAKRRSDGE